MSFVARCHAVGTDGLLAPRSPVCRGVAGTSPPTVPPTISGALCRGVGSGVAFAVADDSYRTAYHEVEHAQPGDVIRKFRCSFRFERRAGDVAELRPSRPPAATLRHHATSAVAKDDVLWCPLWNGSSFVEGTMTVHQPGTQFRAQVTSTVGPCLGDSGTPVFKGDVVVALVVGGDGGCATFVTCQMLPF